MFTPEGIISFFHYKLIIEYSPVYLRLILRMKKFKYIFPKIVLLLIYFAHYYIS